MGARDDGDNGIGHLVVNRAAETGIAWVGVRGSNRAGAASVYAALPMAAGMIGIYSASANHTAPWGGGTDLFSAPILWSLPCRSAPAPILSSSTRRRRS